MILVVAYDTPINLKAFYSHASGTHASCRAGTHHIRMYLVSRESKLLCPLTERRLSALAPSKRRSDGALDLVFICSHGSVAELYCGSAIMDSLVHGWLPPSRQNWELIVYSFQFFPIVRL